MATEMHGAALFNFAAEVARRQALEILARTYVPVVSAPDPTDRAFHEVAAAVQVFEAHIEDALGSPRCQQLTERADVILGLWCQVFEKARDKAALLEQAGR